MLQFISTILSTLFLINRVLAQDLDQADGGPTYQPWSVFSPDKPVHQLGAKVLVVFHGFQSAVPNATYKSIRKLARDQYDVIGINYDYFKVDEQTANLEALAAGPLTGREVAVFGTSLGGFWADWFARKIGAARLILVNPLMDPARQLQRYDGQTVVSERRATKFSVTKGDLLRYASVHRIDRRPGQTLVVLTNGDERFDETRQFFQGDPHVSVKIYDGGHHVDMRESPSLQDIGAFLRADKTFSP
jgi:hypothetical protein